MVSNLLARPENTDNLQIFQGNVKSALGKVQWSYILFYFFNLGHAWTTIQHCIGSWGWGPCSAINVPWQTVFLSADLLLWVYAHFMDFCFLSSIGIWQKSPCFPAVSKRFARSKLQTTGLGRKRRLKPGPNREMSLCWVQVLFHSWIEREGRISTLMCGAFKCNNECLWNTWNLKAMLYTI